jgi:DegV family protein with EDD domain
VPLTVHWGRDILRDRIDLSTREFYLRLRTDPAAPHTAAPPVGIFEDLYTRLLRAYEAVVSLHLSAKFSGTCDVANAAASAVGAERVHVVDSGCTSVGLGWMVQRAAELAEQGFGVDEVVGGAVDTISRVGLYLTLETLDYLQRGGRIGRAQAFLGSLLNVKPILQVRDGEIYPVERVRTRARAAQRLIELVARDGRYQRLAVVHGDCEAEAIALRQELLGRGLAPAVDVVEVGAVVAVYTGPGVLGVGCHAYPSVA